MPLWPSCLMNFALAENNYVFVSLMWCLSHSALSLKIFKRIIFHVCTHSWAWNDIILQFLLRRVLLSLMVYLSTVFKLPLMPFSLTSCAVVLTTSHSLCSLERIAALSIKSCDRYSPQSSIKEKPLFFNAACSNLLAWDPPAMMPESIHKAILSLNLFAVFLVASFTEGKSQKYMFNYICCKIYGANRSSALSLWFLNTYV